MNAKTNNRWPTPAQVQAHRLQLAKWCALHKIPAPSGPIVDAFVAAMGSNQYGVEETWDAFVWFRSGFEAGVVHWNSITIKPVILSAAENGMCESCVNGQCVAGPKCVTLARDSQD